MSISQVTAARTVKRVVGCAFLVVIVCAAPFIGLWAYSYFITDFGRMTDFVAFSTVGTTGIPDSDYELTLAEGFGHSIGLLNKTTLQQTEVLGGVGEDGYIIFQYQSKPYIVIRSYGGGTDGDWNYVVYDISGTTPRVIGGEHVCGNPKLNGDKLEFQDYSTKCDFFPFGGTIKTLEMPLN